MDGWMENEWMDGIWMDRLINVIYANLPNQVLTGFCILIKKNN